MDKFQLLNGEILVASFTHERTLMGDVYKNIIVHEQNQLPIRLKIECSGTTLGDWINRRTVPVNRHHMEAMLGAINLKEPFDVMRYSHALSLNDTFWIKGVDEDVTFAEINLYDNKFDEALGWIAFTGLPSDISHNLSTPELTTSGVLPKYWQRTNDGIILVKGGTSGYANAGFEPYREIAANIVANFLDIETIPYHLQNVKGKIASVCPLFASREQGLMTGGEYLDYKYPNISKKSLVGFFAAIKNDGINDKHFYEMCFLDYIIDNPDRHQSNWGFSVDNQTQTIIGIAPIWDNGAALDYGKPLDMRENFASFDIKYDFIKDCEYTREFQNKVNKLLVAIKSSVLFNRIFSATSEFYPDRELTQRTVDFVESRCVEFLKPLTVNGI
jgi:hypothetical protein